MASRQCCVLCLVAIAALSVASDRTFAQTSSPSPLQFEAKIPLGDVRGRIDHMAIDLPATSFRCRTWEQYRRRCRFE